MESVSNRTASGFLVNYQLDATQRAVRLITVLNEKLQQAARAREGGTLQTAGAGNGHSFQLLVDSNMSPAQFFDMIVELRQAHSNAETALIAAGTPAPTDSQIVDYILGFIGGTAPREVMPDFSGVGV